MTQNEQVYAICWRPEVAGDVIFVEYASCHFHVERCVPENCGRKCGQPQGLLDDYCAVCELNKPGLLVQHGERHNISAIITHALSNSQPPGSS